MSSNKIPRTDTQVIIIGAGGAGLAAAVAATESGASTIILEKRTTPGGNSAMAGGFFAAESKPQKERRIDARCDDLFKMHMDFTHWQVNPRIVRAIINKSANTVQWLEDKGVTIVDIPRFYPNQLLQTWHWPDKNGHGGKLVIKALVERCNNMDISLISGASVKKILVGDNGGVTGVIASTKDGEEFNIHARAVIICTGGYGGNKNLIKKYYPNYTEDMHLFGLPLMGDGLLMAIEIGAATEGLGVLLTQAPSIGHNRNKFMFINTIIGQPNTIWINKKGERFTDEGCVKIRHNINPLLRQPDKTCYSLFDDKIVQTAIDEGIIRGTGIIPATMKLTELRKQLSLASYKLKNIVKVSNSWEEIAKWIGANPEFLRTTIDEYNYFCDKGHDDIFAKDQRYLCALRLPPYYAIKCCAMFSTTLGGIKINHQMGVLNHDDEPIPGLYAAGDAAGGWAWDHYNMTLTGFAFGFALNSGRISGENASRYVLGR